jgi:hypothetical protein
MSKNVIEPISVEGMGTVKQEGGITMEKVYTFRRLNSTDTFLMFKILGKIGINEFTDCFGRDNVKQMIASVTGGDSKESASTMVGISVIFEMASVIITNLPKCEVEIYQMLSQTSNLSVKQVKELDFAIFTEMVIDFIKKEEFKDFIKVVSRLFK